MAISTRKKGYRSRKNAMKVADTVVENIPTIDIKDPKELPERYIVLPADGWQEALNAKREKLAKRDLNVVEPLVLYRLHYVVEMIDYCVALEKKDGE